METKANFSANNRCITCTLTQSQYVLQQAKVGEVEVLIWVFKTKEIQYRMFVQ